MFFDDHDYLNNLARGSPRKHFCQVIMKSVQWFLTRKFFVYRYIGKISPAPWRPCFLMNHDCLNNLDRGLHKKRSCNVILKSVQSFLTRRSLKVSIFFLTNHDGLNNLGKGSPRKHFCQVILKLVQCFLTR